MKLMTKEAVLLLSILLLGAIYFVPRANANPLVVSWYITVTDPAGTPVDGAKLTIIWSTSTSGPFTEMDPSLVEDKIAEIATGLNPPPDIRQNPVITGYFNPEHDHGMAVVDLHLTQVSNYYFYVKIEYPSTIDLPDEYWPIADSYKPGDSTWKPVACATDPLGIDGTPTGYCASGNTLGNGPTTAYPNDLPPDNYVPEVPFGTTVSFLSMITVLIGFIGFRRFRGKSR